MGQRACSMACVATAFTVRQAASEPHRPSRSRRRAHCAGGRPGILIGRARLGPYIGHVCSGEPAWRWLAQRVVGHVGPLDVGGAQVAVDDVTHAAADRPSGRRPRAFPSAVEHGQASAHAPARSVAEREARAGQPCRPEQRCLIGDVPVQYRRPERGMRDSKSPNQSVQSDGRSPLMVIW